MKYLYAGVILLSLITLSSCCTKKKCLYPEHIYLSFSGYAKEDIDTIIVTGYSMQSNFGEVSVAEAIDSTDRYGGYLIVAEDDEDSTTRYYTLPTDNAWQVYIPATQQTFRFQYYLYEMKKCNTCFLAQDLHRSLKSFNVNGKQEGGFSYNIRK